MGRKTKLVAKNIGVRGAGELAGIGLAFGGLAVADNVLKKPYHVVKQSFAHHIVEPNIEFFDGVADVMGGAETKEQAKERKAKPVGERAYDYADSVLDLSLMWSGGWIGQEQLQKRMHAGWETGVTNKENTVTMLVDRGIQIGGVAVMSSSMMRPVTNALQGMFKGIFSKFMDDEAAQKYATYVTVVEVPNTVAFGVSAALGARASLKK
ncbi:MAG: hypothetical protein CMM94_06345 [Rickettsiales bacterium]|nr:hypothetical protein [Rickettsiales bacterium]